MKDNAEDKEKEIDRDYNDPSLVGINFYKQYGQHDDRPLILPQKPSPKEEVKSYEDEVDEVPEKRRPGEIRFGGMSFALPPPGAFPDIPENEYEEYESEYDYDPRPVSDVYPNHPVSSIFPNRPVSEVFRDLPNHQADPTFPTVYPTGQGIKVVQSDPVDIPSFDNFLGSKKSYLKNPFGGDFIKLEIDHDRFDTNKTGPGVHHIPLDVYGYPDVPTYKTADETSIDSILPNENVSSKLFSSKKPLYKPPPVLTEYKPPKSSHIPEYKHQYPDISAQNKNEKVSLFETPHESPISNVQDAMNNIPNALQSLPMFMEKLMGNHADWMQRAWRGRERDESAAA